MSVADQILQRLPELSEKSRIKLLEYLEFLTYQEQQAADAGLEIAQERAAAYDAGHTQPLTKQAFWEQLQQKLG